MKRNISPLSLQLDPFQYSGSIIGWKSNTNSLYMTHTHTHTHKHTHTQTPSKTRDKIPISRQIGETVKAKVMKISLPGQAALNGH